MKEPMCEDLLDFGVMWFMCLLPAGHTGQHEHRNDDPDREDQHRAAYVIRWDAEPTTVSGEVISRAAELTR